MSGLGHTIGKLDTWEHPDKLFTKHIIREGTGDVTANEGSVCTIFFRFVDEVDIPEEELGSYKQDVDTEVTVGEGCTPMSELLDKCVESMKEGEAAYFKSNRNSKGEKIPELDIKKNGLKFNITLKSLSRAADIDDLEPDEKYEQAQHQKNTGSELYKQKNVEFAIKKYQRALKYLQTDPSAKIPDSLEKEFKTLTCQCHLNLAACYLLQEKYDSVVAECDKALGIEVDNVKGLYRRGQAYMHLDKYTEAKKDLQTALKYEPKNSSVAKQLSQVETKIKQEKAVYQKMFAS